MLLCWLLPGVLLVLLRSATTVAKNYDRKILNHASAARGGVSRSQAQKPAPERAPEPMFDGASGKRSAAVCGGMCAVGKGSLVGPPEV